VTIDDSDYKDHEEYRWMESGEPRFITRSYLCICANAKSDEELCLWGNKRGCAYCTKRVPANRRWEILRLKWLSLNPGKCGPAKDQSWEPIGYRAKLEVGKRVQSAFKTHNGALKWLAALEEKFRASNLLCDNDIWTSIELIYETRWDCPTARLAAAV